MLSHNNPALRRIICLLNAKESISYLSPQVMHYVYLIRSLSHANQTYIGLTSDLKARLKKHNEGGSPHTIKFKPWELIHYSAFKERESAAEFEKYLKSGSGRSFARRRLWSKD